MKLQNRWLIPRALRIAIWAGSIGALCIPADSAHGQNPLGGVAGTRTAPNAKRDWAEDMKMKLPGRFTLASVGDLILIRPASEIVDPGFQAAIKIIQSMIRDELNFTGPLGGMFGSKEVAADRKAMRFKIFNRAGNHLMDSNPSGLPTDFDCGVLERAVGIRMASWVGGSVSWRFNSVK